MRKLQVGDKVQIIAGKDKGREGKVEKVFPKKGLVLVPEVNIYKKHVKAPLVQRLEYMKYQDLCLLPN